MKNKKQAMSEKYKAIIKDLKAQLKNGNITETNEPKEENYVEEVAELEIQNHQKIYFEINDVEFDWKIKSNLAIV